MAKLRPSFHGRKLRPSFYGGSVHDIMKTRALRKSVKLMDSLYGEAAPRPSIPGGKDSFYGEAANHAIQTMQTFCLRQPKHGGLSVVVVFVSTGEQHVVDLPTNGTAGDIRATLQLHSLQRLYFSGIKLEDHRVLKDCGVVAQSTLHLVDGTAPDGAPPLPPLGMKKNDNPVPDAQSHVAGKFSKLLPLEDEGKMFRQKLSQLPLDKSLHSFDCRRGLSILFDACVHPQVPESSKLWWWPKIKHFRDLKKGRRVQVLAMKAGEGSWVAGIR